jgi:hypothetical protein
VHYLTDSGLDNEAGDSFSHVSQEVKVFEHFLSLVSDYVPLECLE